jgi:hypothetical protein
VFIRNSPCKFDCHELDAAKAFSQQAAAKASVPSWQNRSLPNDIKRYATNVRAACSR